MLIGIAMVIKNCSPWQMKFIIINVSGKKPDKIRILDVSQVKPEKNLKGKNNQDFASHGRKAGGK